MDPHTRLIPPPVRILVMGGCAQGRATSLLSPQGFEVVWRRGLEASPQGRWDLVILSPGDGEGAAALRVGRGIRAQCAAILLFLLPAETDPLFPIRALKAGADDCLAAPQNPREVLARVRALLRRRERNRRRLSALLKGGLQFDLLRQRVEGMDRRVDLTPVQSRLLAALLARPEEVVSRESLVEEVLGHGSEAFDRAIDVHVSRLRRRLATVGVTELITTCRGVGYRCSGSP